MSVYIGVPHNPSRLDKDWNTQPAGYYPSDVELQASIDQGIKDLRIMMGKELRDAPQHTAYVMWDSMGFATMPAGAGPVVSYNDLANLPLLSRLQVKAGLVHRT